MLLASAPYRIRGKCILSVGGSRPKPLKREVLMLPFYHCQEQRWKILGPTCSVKIVVTNKLLLQHSFLMYMLEIHIFFINMDEIIIIMKKWFLKLIIKMTKLLMKTKLGSMSILCAEKQFYFKLTEIIWLIYNRPPRAF